MPVSDPALRAWNDVVYFKIRTTGAYELALFTDVVWRLVEKVISPMFGYPPGVRLQRPSDLGVGELISSCSALRHSKPRALVSAPYAAPAVPAGQVRVAPGVSGACHS